VKKALQAISNLDSVGVHLSKRISRTTSEEMSKTFPRTC